MIRYSFFLAVALLLSGCAQRLISSGSGAPPVWHRLIASPNSPLTENGVVAFSHDRDNLYIHFDLIDSDIRTKAVKNGETLYSAGDVFEVFIHPAGRREYLELNVAPNKVTTVYFYNSPGTRRLKGIKGIAFDAHQIDLSLDGTLNNETDRDRRWSGTVTIPFAAIATLCGPATPGEPWRIQIARYNYSFYLDRLEQSQLGKSPTNEVDFHNIPSRRLLYFE